MGIYESLTRNNNLLPVAQALKELVQKKRDEEALQNFLAVMDKKKQEVNNLYTAPTETQYNTTPINSPMKDKILGITPKAGMNLNMPDNLPNVQPNTPDMNFGLGDIGKVTETKTQGKLTPQMLYEADRQTNNIMNDTVLEAMKNKWTPEQTGIALSMIERLKQNSRPYVPKMNYQNVKEGEDIIGIDETGNIKPVYENPRTNTKDAKYMWHKIGEGIKNGKEVAIEENIATGERRETELGEVRKTGTNVYVNTEPDVATLVGEINKISSDIKSGKLDEETSTRAYSQLQGKTEELVDRYGLKGASNLIWQRVNKGRSINEAIEDVDSYQKSKKMEGFTPRERDYLYLYFESRLGK